MDLILHIILLLLNVSNVLFHSLGSYLLICIYKNGGQCAQQVFLIHLSICEALMNLLEGLRRIPDFMRLSASESFVNDKIQSFTMIIMFVGISIVYYLDMIYLTLDRLLDMVLGIKYHVYCSEAKAIKLLHATWALALLLSIAISLLYRYANYDWERNQFAYCFPTLNFAFIIISLATYGFIFYKYKETRGLPNRTRGAPNRTKGTIAEQRQTKRTEDERRQTNITEAGRSQSNNK